jgi:hypothetical protein
MKDDLEDERPGEATRKEKNEAEAMQNIDTDFAQKMSTEYNMLSYVGSDIDEI